ncbi:MAG: protein kinase [Polyangiales bacterium]
MLGRKIRDDEYGSVYEARGPSGAAVEVRRIRPDVPPQALELLQRDIEALVVRAPAGIVRVYKLISHGAALWLVSERIEGETLRARLATQARQVHTVVDLICRAAEAVEAAHAHPEGPLIHGSITPASIVVRDDAGAIGVRVQGYGMRWLSDASEQSFADRRGVAGPWVHAAPEQLGVGEVDARADVYALASVLYEMLTGEPPFKAEPLRMVHLKRNEEPEGARIKNAQISPKLEQVLCRALRRDPAARTPSVRRLREELEPHRRRALRRRGAIGVICAMFAGGFALLRGELLAGCARDEAKPPPPTPDAPVPRLPQPEQDAAVTPDLDAGVRGSATIRVCGPSFAAIWPAILANGGALRTQPGSPFDAVNVDVEITPEDVGDKIFARLAGNQADVVLVSVDYFARRYREFQRSDDALVAFHLTGYSQGTLVLVADPTSSLRVDELLKREGKIATTRGTTSEFFARWLHLISSPIPGYGNTKPVLQLVEAATPAKAAELYDRKAVDAAVLWEPFVRAEWKGAQLISTADASNLIAGVLVARRSFLAKRKSDVQRLVCAWGTSAGSLQTQPSSVATVKSVLQTHMPGLAAHFESIVRHTRIATLEDNVAFLAPERHRAGPGNVGERLPAFTTLFVEAVRAWTQVRVQWGGGTVADPDPLDLPNASEMMTAEFLGCESRAAQVGDDRALPKDASQPTRLAAMQVWRPISFASGKAVLDDDGRTAIENLAETLIGVLGNAHIDIIGNTDDLVGSIPNEVLAVQRAGCVLDALVEAGVDRTRLRPLGNGDRKPLVPNTSPENRAINRRTEFHIRPIR